MDLGEGGCFHQLSKTIHMVKVKHTAKSFEEQDFLQADKSLMTRWWEPRLPQIAETNICDATALHYSVVKDNSKKQNSLRISKTSNKIFLADSGGK